MGASLHRLRHSVEPIAFFVATLIVLAVFAPHAPLHLDTARDLRIAHECVHGARCNGAGPMSSLFGLAHGALWVHVLEIAARLSLTLRAIERIVDVSIALGAAALAATARAMNVRSRILAWLLWLGMALHTAEYPVLWQPSLLPLTVAVFYLACALALVTGRTSTLAIAAGALGASIATHIGAAALVPLFMVATITCATRPALATLTTAIVMALVVALDAPRGLAHNLRILAPHTKALVGGAAATIVAGVLARRALRRHPVESRARIVSLACVGGFVGAVSVGFIVTHHELAPRYFAPVVPLVALIAAAAVDRFRHRLVVTLVAGCAVVISLARQRSQRAREGGWELRDVDILAGELFARGTFADVVRRVRGPQAYDLVATLGAVEPACPGRDATSNEDWLVLRSSRERLPSGPNVELRALAGGSFLAIVSYVPAVDTSWTEICRSGACTEVTIDGRDLFGHTNLPSPAYGYLAVGPITRALEATSQSGGAVTFRLRVRASEPRHLVLLDDDRLAWSIERTSFAAVPSGARSVDVPAGTVGEILFSARELHPGWALRGWLPPFVELAPEDRALVEPLLSR